jgi:hypothetical protein
LESSSSGLRKGWRKLPRTSPHVWRNGPRERQAITSKIPLNSHKSGRDSRAYNFRCADGTGNLSYVRPGSVSRRP